MMDFDEAAQERLPPHSVEAEQAVLGGLWLDNRGLALVSDLIDSGSGPGLIRIRNSADALLAEVVLTDPCGAVNGTTGQITFSIATNEDAATGGTAAYGEFCNSAGTVHLALPCQAGTSPVSGKLVLNSLTLVAGGPDMSSTLSTHRVRPLRSRPMRPRSVRAMSQILSASRMPMGASDSTK